MFGRLLKRRRSNHSLSLLLIILFCLSALITFLSKYPATVSAQNVTSGGNKIVPIIPPGSAYRQTNLISDIPGFAPVQDPLLVNPWGITFLGMSPFWIVNNRTRTTQLVRGDVGGAPVVLNTSPQTINIPCCLPTGIVENTTSDFQISPPGGGSPAVSRFIFSTITGDIDAWNGSSGAIAQTIVSMPGHVYTGLAMGSNSGGSRLYAADFINNHIDVFDGAFMATTVTGGFTDVTVPPDYHVHNIQNLGGSLYVTYAKINGSDVENGPGEGFVRKFNTDGERDPSFAIDNGVLDAPWGLAIAPASFGVFGGALLVGNFSDDGFISAYNPSTGAALIPSEAADNRLVNEAGQPIVIDELWGLKFGNGFSGGDLNTLYFTAGTAEEEHGLFGKINPTTAQATSLIQFASAETSVDEAGGHVDVTVIRNGDTSSTATISYNTYDESSPGHASQKSDYEIAAGKITFNPGETSKTFRILIVNDSFVEGDEEVNLALSNPTGAGVGLGSPSQATLTILDNDTVSPTSNPIDDPTFFVRQNYLDFYNREPDGNGAALVAKFTDCGPNQPCINRERLAIATSFFTSNEFFGLGSLIARTHKAAFGPFASASVGPVLYGEFEIDLQFLQNNAALGPAGDAQREANKNAYFADFVTRPQFVNNFPTTLTPAQYTDALFANAGFMPPAAERQAVIDFFGGAGNTTNQTARINALRRVAENATFKLNEFNSDFVLLSFFVFERRDADTLNFNFKLNALNTAGGDFNKAFIIKRFITFDAANGESGSEYRQRFGPDLGFTITKSAPDAVNDTVTTLANTPVTINVLANDADYDGTNFTLSSVTPGTGGTPSINGTSVLFTPIINFTGTATFTYTITDGTDTDTATVTVNVVSGGTFQFSSSTASVSEGAGRVTLTVTRSGDSSVPASVDFGTVFDPSVTNCSTVSGHASDRCDYTTALGRLSFANGEVSKTIDIFITNDSYAEGNETFSVALSNPIGTNFTIGGTGTATVTITDNEATNGANPIATVPFFVFQHYIDFLGRDPDPPGFAGWQNILNNCAPGNTTCDRVEVSSAFYRSPEFQVRGYFLYRFYKAALGRNPLYREFMMDLSRVSGFLTDAQLEANKGAFVVDFMSRGEFVTKYNPTLNDPTAYVKLLEQTAGVTLSNEQQLIIGLTNQTETRATVLRKMIESPEVANKFFNEGFVVEAYFGYLRRDPDAAFMTWLQLLNQNNDRRALVSGFVNSNEYVQRFGP